MRLFFAVTSANSFFGLGGTDGGGVSPKGYFPSLRKREVRRNFPIIVCYFVTVSNEEGGEKS